MSIVVVGSANTDLVIQVDALPEPGETVLGGAFVTASGGKGANQAVAVARLSGAVQFLASIGRDHFGDDLIQKYRDESIDTHLIQRPDQTSGIAMIYVAKNGQNSIAVAPGSNALLSPAHIDGAEAELKKASIVLTQLEIPVETVLRLAETAAQNDATFVLDPAPAQALPDGLYALTDVITPNETEATALTGISIKGERDARRAAESLLHKGVKNAIITLAEKGALLCTEQGAQHIDPVAVKAVDTTGAGDTFNAALASALYRGESMVQAVVFANRAAALSTTRLGAQPSIPFLDELQAE